MGAGENQSHLPPHTECGGYRSHLLSHAEAYVTGILQHPCRQGRAPAQVVEIVSFYLSMHHSGLGRLVKYVSSHFFIHESPPSPDLILNVTRPVAGPFVRS